MSEKITYNRLNIIGSEVITSYVNAEMRLAIAESVTGGLIGHIITNQDNSSRVFGGSLVVYSALAKELVLGIPMSFILENGTISEAMTAKMLEAMDKFPIDVSLAITGIAGKSVEGQKRGVVYIGTRYMGHNEIKKFQFHGSRIEIKLQAAEAALRMLMDVVENRK